MNSIFAFTYTNLTVVYEIQVYFVIKSTQIL